MYLFASFLLSGICVLTRAVAIFLPLILLIAGLLKDRKNILKISLGLLLTISFTVGPWVYRNYKVFNVFGLTSLSGFNLFYDKAAYVYIMKNPGSSEDEAQKALEKKFASYIETEDFKRENSFKKSIVLGNLGKKYIMENKRSYIKAHFKGVLLSLTQIAGPFTFLLTGESKGTGIFASLVFNKDRKTGENFLLPLFFITYNIFLAFLYLAAFKGFLNLLKKDRGNNNFNYLYLVIAIYLLIFPGPGGFSSFDRFRVPIMPFILFLSAYGLFGGKRSEKGNSSDACL